MMGGRYRTITEVLDFGPYITTVLLETNTNLHRAAVDAALFEVEVTRHIDLKQIVWPEYMGKQPHIPVNGKATITDAYISDADGSRRDEGSYIALRLKADPRDALTSILQFNGILNVIVPIELVIRQKEIKQADGSIAITTYDENCGNKICYGELLQEGYHKDSEMPLRFVFYDPKNDGKTGHFPLIIWLHGAGEGGNDPLVPAIANRVVNLLSPGIQSFFGEGAYLLCPQSPTMWMDDGTGEYTKDGRSRYTEPLERLIRDFVKTRDDIDKTRIYIGGDSNGGYMTLNMILRNPVRYAAAFPVCESYLDEWLDDNQINELAKVPIWFTAAKTDTVVPVRSHAQATYQRLKAVTNDIHFTLWEKVEDRTGRYTDENGRPFEYHGHWSWVPMLNNECRLEFDGEPVRMDGREVTLLEWVSGHRRSDHE